METLLFVLLVLLVGLAIEHIVSKYVNNEMETFMFNYYGNKIKRFVLITIGISVVSFLIWL